MCIKWRLVVQLVSIYLRNGEGRAPVILEDVKTDLSLAVDVAVVDSCLEGHLVQDLLKYNIINRYLLPSFLFTYFKYSLPKPFLLCNSMVSWYDN